MTLIAPLGVFFWLFIALAVVLLCLKILMRFFRTDKANNLDLYVVMLDCKEDNKTFFINCDSLVNHEEEIAPLLESISELNDITYQIEDVDLKRRNKAKGEARIVGFSGRAYYEE